MAGYTRYWWWNTFLSSTPARVNSSRIEVRSRPPRSEAFVPENSRSPAYSASSQIISRLAPPPRLIPSAHFLARQSFRCRLRNAWRRTRQSSATKKKLFVAHSYSSIIKSNFKPILILNGLFCFRYDIKKKNKWHIYAGRLIVMQLSCALCCNAGR